MTERAVVITGGVGGAKLVLGLSQVMAPEDITAVVNTGDDFRHLGMHVSPDIDTLLYTLSNKANQVQGWGREGESWNFMAALRELGGEDWFALGDGDMALHVLRTLRMSQGDTLAKITQDFAATWGIGAEILPMSNAPVTTCLDTDEGRLDFQEYFVRRRCEPRVQQIVFQGADEARPAPGVTEAIAQASVILIAPSNPYLSVDPVLSVPGIRQALQSADAPVVAVSPIIGGKAVKGPTAKLMADLSVPIDNSAIGAHYGGMIDGLLIHSGDSAPDNLFIGHTDTLMQTIHDRVRVAEAALALGRSIEGR